MGAQADRPITLPRHREIPCRSRGPTATRSRLAATSGRGEARRRGRVAAVIVREPLVDPEELRRRTGWHVKPVGACKAELCVPLPPAARAGGRIDVRVLAERLGMPLVEDEEHGLLALGPETLTGRALQSAELPELVLPDLDGRPFAFSSLRGRRVVLVAWASW